MIPTQLKETGSLSQAVENTFDGDHPCGFCHAAEKLQLEESPEPDSPSPSQKDLKKPVAKDVLVSALRRTRAPRVYGQFQRLSWEHSIPSASLSERPPLPPPREIS